MGQSIVIPLACTVVQMLSAGERRLLFQCSVNADLSKFRCLIYYTLSILLDVGVFSRRSEWYVQKLIPVILGQLYLFFFAEP